MDVCEEETMTVTIALDSPQLKQNQDPGVVVEDAKNNFLQIQLPPSSSDLLVNWQQLPPLKIRDLHVPVANLLEMRLNPPVCGSMRNWEFLAAHFGLSLDEIVGLRRSENPMRSLLRKFGHESLMKLLEMIGQSERIDVLLSLVPFTRQNSALTGSHLQNEPPKQIQMLDSGLSAASISSLSVRPGPSRSPPKGPFLLILHHELQQNHDLRRFQRMLLTNLKHYAKPEGIKVLDVDNCICEEDLFGSLQRHFERAWQVLLALSPDYAEAISTDAASVAEDSLDQRIQLKRNLHQMTFQEVLYNRGENRRFRLVLMRGTFAEHVPRGWPSNTLHYRFPEDFADLCQRLFEKTERNW